VAFQPLSVFFRVLPWPSHPVFFRVFPWPFQPLAVDERFQPSTGPWPSKLV